MNFTESDLFHKMVMKVYVIIRHLFRYMTISSISLYYIPKMQKVIKKLSENRSVNNKTRIYWTLFNSQHLHDNKVFLCARLDCGEPTENFYVKLTSITEATQYSSSNSFSISS